MATYQTTYANAPAKGLPGQLANTELANVISRTVESSAGIEFGQPAFRGSGDHGVIVGATQAGTAVGAAGTPAPAGATITAAPAVAAGAKAGVYTVLCVSAGATGKWRVEDPDGVYVGIATTGTEFVGGGLTFTITDSGTDPAVGESFTITVTLTANAAFVGIAVLHPAVPPAASTPDKYPQYFTGAFATKGQLYVTAGDSVVDGGDVYWNPATKRYTSTVTHVRIPGAKFDTSGGNGDIVEVSLGNR
ncbi:structural cement protein Gp24 [Rhodoplanes serenus]|uniref:structural cement protein Gp24 n=1 Tax=Rhodoplanes serenus TaxID=200615 RepID=UPI000DAC787B|nr:hypothetical protein [Rhodoplanes serenus]RAI34537.1 hypothetical protein CH340_08905 [Rhodoplanes serenus]